MNKKLTIAFTILLCLMMVFVACDQLEQSSTTPNNNQDDVTGGNGDPAVEQSDENLDFEPIEIVYIDRNGNEHLVDLTMLMHREGVGGFIKSSGSVVDPATFTGPYLQDIVDIFGGYTEEDALEIMATDRYRMTFTKEQAQGHIEIYDRDFNTLSVGPTDVMVAIESKSEEMNYGMPRLVFTTPDTPIITHGHFWIRDIAEIKVVPSVIEWTLSLTGYGEYVCDRSTFESVANCHVSPHPPQVFEQENSDGQMDVYEGVALWVMISTVDGNDLPSGHYMVNRELAQQGYTVQIYAEDGFMVELTSDEIYYNNDIILAYRKNGAPLLDEDGPLQLVGEGLPTRRHAIKNIERIELVGLP
ncbi:hypothetical protein [Desulfuribacillus alkaliarsenatis]|uniref:Oxidoreductase molybdopterin-binding domain-containing protein n=1 Tax=Desulfuribacillus alkaliarsenatis TaxID=766136 RepID=A0A1E5FZB3_9FIRM|nr:hypothetical protein [Desulfuribacillus alkaliarsenatis]OEF95911.1 hypothetical protein BHF68_11005 [Desulfuribacillus alkaliarsenatis]